MADNATNTTASGPPPTPGGEYKAKGDEVAVKQLEKRIQGQKDRISLDKGEVMGKDGAPAPILNPAEFSKNNPTNEETARIKILAGL